MNFRYKLIRFMCGRYGIDNTFYVLFVIGAILAIVNSFVRNWILQLIVYVIIIVAFLRVLSRNIDARRKENNVVTGWITKLYNCYSTNKRRKADTTHIYRKCPNCKATLRLPRRKGKHTTVCPKCGKQFKLFVF